MPDTEKTLVVVERALEDEDRVRRLMEVMPDGMDPKRFIRATLTAIARNDDLLKCTPASIVLAVFDAAEAGFVPTGSMSRAWLVPYRVNVARRGQPQKYEWHARLNIGYQGLADLMRDGGAIKIESRPVYQGDIFEVRYGTSPTIDHVPMFKASGPEGMTHVYAVGTLLERETIFEVLTKEDVDHVRASGAGNSPAWIQHYVQMARKTAIRRLANYMALSERAQSVIAKDDLVTIAPVEPLEPDRRTAEVRAKLAEKLGVPPPPNGESENEPPDSDDWNTTPRGPTEPATPVTDVADEPEEEEDQEALFAELDAAEAAKA